MCSNYVNLTITTVFYDAISDGSKVGSRRKQKMVTAYGALPSTRLTVFVENV